MWAGFVRTAAGDDVGLAPPRRLRVDDLRGDGRSGWSPAPGARDVVDAGPGDFFYVPPWAVHREHNPGDEESHLIVVRAGSGPAVINVDGPADCTPARRRSAGPGDQGQAGAEEVAPPAAVRGRVPAPVWGRRAGAVVGRPGRRADRLHVAPLGRAPGVGAARGGAAIRRDLGRWRRQRAAERRRPGARRGGAGPGPSHGKARRAGRRAVGSGGRGDGGRCGVGRGQDARPAAESHRGPRLADRRARAAPRPPPAPRPSRRQTRAAPDAAASLRSMESLLGTTRTRNGRGSPVERTSQEGRYDAFGTDLFPFGLLGSCLLPLASKNCLEGGEQLRGRFLVELVGARSAESGSRRR